jgi:23S rRNA (uracil1939-C5)-methyltransferase
MDMEVIIERILPGGLGLGHADGKTIMVALSAPGDRVRVRIEREKGTVAFASIEEILSPSEFRVEPPCPYFGSCGGCDFQQLNYEAQLQAKVEIIRDCLRRIASLTNIPEFEIVAAPKQWHYRSRTQWQFDSIRRRLGYFESSSRRVCDVAECAVLVPELQQTLEKLREEMNQGSLPADLRHFRAVVGDEGVSIASDKASITRHTRSDNSPEVTRTIGGKTYHVNAKSFFQTNADLLPRLIDAALADTLGQSAIELYCGVGLFTIPLAGRFARVIAVEDDESAANFARLNLTSAGLSTTKVANQDVGDWLAQNVKLNEESALHGPVDFLLLDPPRAGAESRVIAGILELRPRHICYVSCDPATLARDLKKLLAENYTVKSLIAFDMFPQTHHVETVMHLNS